jgi:limonene-1,2-epoxide hydrolase
LISSRPGSATRGGSFYCERALRCFDEPGFKRADGSEIGAAMVMGIFEVEGNPIVAWRDYYDVRNAEKWATS